MCRIVCSALVAAALTSVFAAAQVFAGNVDLSTVPKRNSVQLTIYNSEDLTLVRETRMVTFKKGVNPQQHVRMYLLTNNKDSKLGTSPLPVLIRFGLGRGRSV